MSTVKAPVNFSRHAGVTCDPCAWVPGVGGWENHPFRLKMLAVESALEDGPIKADFAEEYDDDGEPLPSVGVSFMLEYDDDLANASVDTSGDLAAQVLSYVRGLADAVESRFRAAGLLPSDGAEVPVVPGAGDAPAYEVVFVSKTEHGCKVAEALGPVSREIAEAVADGFNSRNPQRKGVVAVARPSSHPMPAAVEGGDA